MPQIVGNIQKIRCGGRHVAQIGIELPGDNHGLIAVGTQMVVAGFQHIQKGIQLPVQLIQLAVDVLHLHKRLHLPRNAAHILSSQYMAGVGTVLDISLVQSAHDTSCIVSHMSISNGSLVAAIIYLTVADPGDAPGIHMGVQPGTGGCFLQIFHCKILQLIYHIIGINIDVSPVDTVIYGSVVAACDSAAAAVSQHCHFGGAAADHAAVLIDTRNAAHFLLSLQHAGYSTVYYTAVIFSRQNARLTATALGKDPGLRHRQLLNHRALLQITKQARLRTVPPNLQTADRMSLTVKNAAKHRDFNCPAVQIQIRLQYHPLISGPFVIATGRRQLLQLFHTGNTDDFI